VKDTSSETQPAGVVLPTQAGETVDRWSWVERAVWTDRMLAALVTGVKGGKWFSLMDKVFSTRNLQGGMGGGPQAQGGGGSGRADRASV
jgi:hypothetical protein